MKSGVYGCGQGRKAQNQSFGERHMQLVHFVLIHWDLLCRWYDADTFRRMGIKISTMCRESNCRVRAWGWASHSPGGHLGGFAFKFTSGQDGKGVTSVAGNSRGLSGLTLSGW